MIPSVTVVRLAIRLMSVAPVTTIRWIARGCGAVAYVVAGARRATLLENQRYLAPNDTPRQHRRRARRTFCNLLDAAVDLWRLPTLPRGRFESLIRIEGRGYLDAALALGRGVIIAAPHLGPYELGGAWLAHAGYPVHAIVELIDPATNAALARYREATGMKLISRSGGLRAALRVLRGGEVVLLAADRVVGDGSEGLPVPFGRGTRAVPTGPATLSLATGAPIIVGYITRRPEGASRYLLKLEPAIVPEAIDQKQQDRERITRQVGERLATAVQSHSDEWFVFQPAWI